MISRLNRAKLLVIDDLGAERDTDYALEKVYNVVDSRYRAKRPILLRHLLLHRRLIRVALVLQKVVVALTAGPLLRALSDRVLVTADTGPSGPSS